MGCERAQSTEGCALADNFWCCSADGPGLLDGSAADVDEATSKATTRLSHRTLYMSWILVPLMPPPLLYADLTTDWYSTSVALSRPKLSDARKRLW